MKTIPNTFGVTEETYQGYLWLLKAANYSGYVCRSEASLIRELRLSKDALADLLAELTRAKLIEIKSPLPFLVLRLPLWSGKRRKSRSLRPGNQAVSTASAAVPAALSLNKYLSSSSSAAADINKSGGGVPGEGDLAAEVARATGWNDRAELETVLASHSPPVVRKVLGRLAQVPESQIRTSRIALFRFLLKKFAQVKSNAHDPPTHHNPFELQAPASSRGPAPAPDAHRALALPGASLPA